MEACGAEARRRARGARDTDRLPGTVEGREAPGITAGCTNLILVPIWRGRRSPRVLCIRVMWAIVGRGRDSTAVGGRRSADFCGRGLPRGAGSGARAIGVARGGAARSGRGGRGAAAGGARAPGGPAGRGGGRCGGALEVEHRMCVWEQTVIGPRRGAVDRRTGSPRAARQGRGPPHGASSGREAGPWTASPGLLGPRGGPLDRRTGPPPPPTRSRGAPHPGASTPGPPPRAPPRPAWRGLSRADTRRPPRRRTWGCGCRRRRAPPPGRGGRGPRAGPRRRRGG